jgi:hypothetical protein
MIAAGLSSSVSSQLICLSVLNYVCRTQNEASQEDFAVFVEYFEISNVYKQLRELAENSDNLYVQMQAE